MIKKKVPEELKNTFQWLLSEMWEVFILSSLGEYDGIEEKLGKVLLFARKQGITEISMSLEEEISDEGLLNLINKFKQ